MISYHFMGIKEETNNYRSSPKTWALEHVHIDPVPIFMFGMVLSIFSI